MSVSSSWDRLTSFLRSVPNHNIDDDLIREYFYRGKDDNNKVVLDTITGGSFGEFNYADIAEKLEKISKYNKFLSTRKSDTKRNIFAVQVSYNPATYKIHEDMSQMKTKIGWVLKHVPGGAKKETMVNYLAKHPPLVDEYY